MKRLKNLFLEKTLIAIILCFTFLTYYIPPVYAAETSELIIGQTYYGFKLTDVKTIDEIHSTAKVFEHVKSGAKLVYLENNDENKVFAINFYTVPTDDTGVNHIIEHSVLDGSLKYPVKSPFKQMSKQSLQTYLNASTYSDRTCFPVASENDKDLKNLMSVYLDAVFYPNLLKDPKIFAQEGWRYDLDSSTGNIKYNGVVYNEMKARYSSAEDMLNFAVNKSLYPDTLYQWNAGGNPDLIPKLTYEKLLEVYKKNYQPSNAYIYLYGKLNLMDYLKFIDDQYLSKFNKVSIDNTIPKQPPFTSRHTLISEYPVSKNADTSNNTYISLNYVLDNMTDNESYISMDVLDELLMSTNGPLKKAIGNAKISQSSYSGISRKSQPSYSIVLKNSNEASKSTFETLVTETLETAVKEGFDKKSIEDAFTSYEASNGKDDSTSSGINLNQNIMCGWLYAKNPTEYLGKKTTIDKLKNSVDSKYFQDLIKNNLLFNNHTSLVILKPNAGMEEDNIENIAQKLANYKASLSPAQLELLVKQTDDFKAWQNSEDSKESINSLPALSISDINPKAEVVPLEEKEIDGVKILYHNIDTNSDYVNMYFDTTAVPQDKLLYLRLLSDILGKTDTDKFTYTNMKNLLQASNGSLNFDIIAPPKYNDVETYYPKLVLSTRFDHDKMPEILNLAYEITEKTKLDNKTKIKSFLKSIKTNMDNNFNDIASATISSRVQSYFSPSEAYRGQDKLSYYHFICDLYNNYDNDGNAVIQNLEDVCSMVFNKNNLLISFVGNENKYSDLEKNLSTVLSRLGATDLQKYSYNFDLTPKNEGIMSTSKVQYIVKGSNINHLGYQFNGNLYVLQSILAKDYLYNNIRVKGGAYGTGVSVYNNGSILLYSLRDPNLRETLKTFDGAPDYLRNLKISDEDMKNYIIGTMASIDAPKTPNSECKTSDINYIIGKTQADIQRERDQILSAKKEDMVKYADMLDAILKENNLCVFGSETLINKNKDIFGDTLNLSDMAK